MKKSKKVVALTLGLTMAMTAAAGCGKKGDSVGGDLPDPTFEVDANTPSWKVDDSTCDLTWYVGFDWFTPGKQESVAAKYITEDTGVTITYTSGADDKLNSLIAANNLPDIITVDAGSSTIPDLEKIAYPLEELAAKYDPYFMTGAADPEIIEFYKNEDGHLYMYPNYAVPPSDYEKGGVYGNDAFIVRKDIYEQIGSPDMSTQEGFMEALQKVKELGATDANGKEVIPLGMNNLDANWVGTDIALANSLGVPHVEDGKLYDRYTDEAFVSWLKVLADANRKGLMDPDVATMSGGDREAKISNGSYFAYINANLNADPYTLTNWYNLDPEKAYIAVKGPSTDRPATLEGPSIAGWTRTFIPKSCTNPQKAMELVTYLVSEEGTKVAYFGREGQDYEIVDGVVKQAKEIKDLYNVDPVAYQTKYGFGETYMLQNTANVSRLSGIEQFVPALQQIKGWTADYIISVNETFDKDRYMTAADKRNWEKINTQWCQTFASIIQAKDDAEVDALMKEFTDFRDVNNYDSIMEARNKAVADNCEKLDKVK